MIIMKINISYLLLSLLAILFLLPSCEKNQDADLSYNYTRRVDTTSGNSYAFFLPNIFSPDGDGNNDFYLPYGESVHGIKNLKMSITAAKISLLGIKDMPAYLSDKGVCGWNGMDNDHNEQPEGTYVAYYSFETPNGGKVNGFQTVYLRRRKKTEKCLNLRGLDADKLVFRCDSDLRPSPQSGEPMCH